MAADKIPKWQEQIEAILREKYQGDELTRQLETVNALISLVEAVDMPSGDTGGIVSQLLKNASEELRPLTATYAAFQLGVAYERYQNGNRT